MPKRDHIRLLFRSPDTLRRLARATIAEFVLVTAITSSVSVQAQNNNFSSLATAADAARQQGDIPKAIELYRSATEQNPEWPDGWWFLGILEYDQNQYEPAREALTRYLHLTPKAAPALALRGVCEFNTGSYEQALQDLETADALGAANQAKNAQILYFHEGLLLSHFGRFEEALAKFNLLIQQGADSPDLEIAVGLAGLHLNSFPNAVPPDQAPLLSSVGHAAMLLMQRNYDAGRQIFEALFMQYPRHPNLHYLYGYLLFPTNPDAATEQFHEELEIAPQNSTAHAMYAWALELQGNFAAALGEATKAAGEDPSLPMAQLVYGKALVETGDLKGSLPHLERVLESQPDNLEAHLALVKAYSKLGRSDDARRERLLCLSMSQQGAASVAAP